jgi:uncharacterized protein YhfF
MPERLCELGYPGPLRDQLVGAALRGDKTATSSLLQEWEEDGEALPQPGERQTLIDSEGRGVAVIEIVAVDVIRLADADMRLALDEGEGFRSVAEWREAHEEFWSRAVDDDTQVVVERFRLVERL